MSTVFSFSDLQKVVALLSVEVRKQDFLTYFKKFSLLSVTENSITLGVISAFHRDNLTRKFSADIEKAVHSIHPHIERVEIIIDDAIESRDTLTVIDCRLTQKESEKITKNQQVNGIEIVEGLNSRLTNDRYKLDNFIIGPGTQLAHAACEAVARRP